LSKCCGKPETINEFGQLEVDCNLVHLERPSKLRIFVAGKKRRNTMKKRRIYLKYICPKLNRLCQFCRSLSRKEHCPECTTWRWICFAYFRLCVGHDCLGTHLHRNGILPDTYCMLCSLREPMDRNHLEQSTALFNRTDCERYWEARTIMMENWLGFRFITNFVTTFYYYDLHIYLDCCL